MQGVFLGQNTMTTLLMVVNRNIYVMIQPLEEIGQMFPYLNNNAV